MHRGEHTPSRERREVVARFSTSSCGNSVRVRSCLLPRCVGGVSGLQDARPRGIPGTALKFPWAIACVFGRMVEDRSSLLACVLDSSARPDLCWSWTGVAASEQEGLGTERGCKACDVLPSAASLVQVTLHKPITNIQLEVANHGGEIGSC